MAGLIHLPGVAGCDEAGRGPLAGPVVCAAVVLPRGFDTRGLNDSKKLTAQQRSAAEDRIKCGSDWAIAVVSHQDIDRMNILRSSLFGMSRALESLQCAPEFALIDGNHVPLDAPCRCEPQIQGDAAYACIAAASILAKNARDRIMTTLHDLYPEYGFNHNFGYPTRDHIEALRVYGPSAVHRMTFGPVALVANQPTLDFGEEVSTATETSVRSIIEPWPTAESKVRDTKTVLPTI